MFVWMFTVTQNKLRVDDVLGVWPLHGLCGAWGGLACGIFDKSQKYTLTCEDKQHVVKMEKSIERRPNFECVEITEVELLRAA